MAEKKDDGKKQDERDLAILIVGALMVVGVWRVWTGRLWPWLQGHSPHVDTSAVGGIDPMQLAGLALLLVPVVLAGVYARWRARLRPARVPRRVQVSTEKPSGVTQVL